MSDVRPETLVMFSGGKDSFLAAIREIAAGRRVVLVSFDSGHLVAHAYLRLCADRLSRRYGAERAEYLGCYNTTPTVSVLTQYWTHSTQAAVAAEYPDLTNCQVACLHCQVAMWVAAVALAEARGVRRVAAGYKASDEFCTGRPFFVDAMRDLAAARGIDAAFPVWDVGDDYERDCEIALHGFQPVRCEPKCLAGQPPRDGGDDALFDDMRRYLDERLVSEAARQVDHLRPIFRHVRLTDVPFDVDVSGVTFDE